MRPAAALAFAAATSSLAAGCAHRGQRNAAYAAEAAAMTIGALMINDASDRENDPYLPDSSDLERGLGLSMVVIGAAAFVVTLATSPSGDDTAAPAAPPPMPALAELPPIPQVPSADPTAVRLTLQARRAAVAGQCRAVDQLAPRVRSADEVYYRTVFATDPAVVSCGPAWSR